MPGKKKYFGITPPKVKHTPARCRPKVQQFAPGEIEEELRRRERAAQVKNLRDPKVK